MKILHIGYPKTGTTFLQTRLFGPLSIAGKIGAYVGNDGTGGKHTKNPIQVALIRLGGGEIPLKAKADLLSFVESQDNFLISVEGILESSEDGNLLDLSHRLSGVFASDTEILITVRQFDTYFSSYYQEMVKGDFVTSPEDAFFPTGDPDKSAIRKTPYPNFRKYDLDGLVNALLRNFEKVTLLDLRLPGYLSWFADRSGIAIEELEKLIESKAKTKRGTNESLSPGWVRFLELVNWTFRKILLSLGIRGDGRRPTSFEISASNTPERRKLQILVRAITLKVMIKQLVVRFSPFVSALKTKYELPESMNKRILMEIPESKLLQKTRTSGGVLSCTS